MLTLLIKDFKLMFSGGRNGLKGFFRALFSLFFTACFVGIEIVLFSAILMRIRNISNAPQAFLQLFLLIISVIMTITGVFQAKKLFFNEQDIQQLVTHPIENSKLILSKLVFLFAIHYVTALLFLYPLFASYGIIFNKSTMFFYKALFYPLLAAVFELGIALILVSPVRLFLEYLKRHVALEFCVSVLLLLGLTFPYSKVLNIFVGLVTNNELSLLFTEETLATVTKIGEYAFPINFLADVFIMKKNTGLLPYLAIAGGIFVLGLSLTVFNFHKIRAHAANSKPQKIKINYKKRSQTFGLIKKEVMLLTKNPDYIFSFSGLLLIQPFLLYLIVVAMNAIFGTGTFLYYTTLFPNFVALVDVFLVIMVTLIINSGANQYISMEEKTIKNLKTIPVSCERQLMIKMMIPYSFSMLFLLISVAVLCFTGVLSLLSAAFALLLTAVVVFVFDVISLREELHIRHGKPRSSFLSTIYSYVLPFAYIALVMFLSYNGFPLWAMYLMGILLFFLLGIPHILKVKRYMVDWFMELEAIN